jgi:hypothetical protein
MNTITVSKTAEVVSSVCALGAYRRDIDFVETGSTGRRGFVVYRYSITNNGLSSKNPILFTG